MGGESSGGTQFQRCREGPLSSAYMPLTTAYTSAGDVTISAGDVTSGRIMIAAILLVISTRSQKRTSLCKKVSSF